MKKPRIFVSSTILDFEDLRSALKYYLTELGYDIQMSEYPDFDVDTDGTTFDSCISNLKNCQYFILLIGYRRGNWYLKNEVSITHKEFLSAKELIEGGHPLRIITFIRKPIWLLKNDRHALQEHFRNKLENKQDDIESVGTSVIDDPKYIFNFINEVSMGISYPGSNSPANNWIYDFDSFEDIITALRHTFRLTDSLDSMKLRALFLRELNLNRSKFLTFENKIDFSEYADSQDIPKENCLEIIARKYCHFVIDERGKLKGLGDNIDFPGSEILGLLYYTTLNQSILHLRNLNTSILNRVINEGEYLTFNLQKNEFSSNELIYALEKLYEMIRSLTVFHKSEIFTNFTKDLAKLVSDGSGYKDQIKLPISVAVTILMYSNGARIFDLIEGILQYIEEENTSPIKTFDYSVDYIKKYSK